MDDVRAFEWNAVKAASNLAKHGIPFEYATRIFLDAHAVDIDASRTVDREVRRKIVGAVEGRVLTLVYAERNGTIRIISARPSNDKEGKLYGQVRTRF